MTRDWVRKNKHIKDTRPGDQIVKIYLKLMTGCHADFKTSLVKIGVKILQIKKQTW